MLVEEPKEPGKPKEPVKPQEKPEEPEGPKEAEEEDPQGRNIPSLQQVAEVLKRYHDLKALEPGIGQRRAAIRLGCSQSMLSRYLKKEDRIGTAELHKKKDVPHRIRKAWDKDLKELERHIYHKVKRMCDQRADGLDPDAFPAIAQAVADKKGFHWRAWKYPNGQAFTFSAAWMKAFNTRYDVKAVMPRTRKAISPKEEVEAAVKFHKKLRAVLRCEGPIVAVRHSGSSWQTHHSSSNTLASIEAS